MKKMIILPVFLFFLSLSVYAQSYNCHLYIVGKNGGNLSYQVKSVGILADSNSYMLIGIVFNDNSTNQIYLSSPRRATRDSGETHYTVLSIDGTYVSNWVARVSSSSDGTVGIRLFNNNFDQNFYAWGELADIYIGLNQLRQ